MPVQQFFRVGPMKLMKCTGEELKSLRGAVSKAGSKVKGLVMNTSQEEDAGATVYVCAHAYEKLSAAMWAKQLGVPRIHAEVVQCTDGIEQGMRECREEYGLSQEDDEQYGACGDGKKKKRSQQEVMMEEDSGSSECGSPMADSPKKVCTTLQERAPPTTTVGTAGLPLLETLLEHHFEKWIGVVAPKLAWDKFNQLAVFWYFRQGGKREFVNSSHMSVVFQAMCAHPQSHSGWVDLVECKKEELFGNSAGAWKIDAGLLRHLLKQRLGAYEEHNFTPEKMWAKLEEWTAAYDKSNNEEGSKPTLIQAMCEHPQSNIEWRIHAVKQNRYYAQ